MKTIGFQTKHLGFLIVVDASKYLGLMIFKSRCIKSLTLISSLLFNPESVKSGLTGVECISAPAIAFGC